MAVAATIVTLGSAPVLAQEEGQGMMGQGHRIGGMEPQGGMESTDTMNIKMQELRQHEKMMEGIKNKNQHQMMTEMRKHMQMMTDMMEGMRCQQGGAGCGSGGTPDHPMPK